MRLRAPVLVPLLVALAGCPGGGDDTDPLYGDLVRLDDASEEVLQIIIDHVQRDGTITGDAGAQLTGPADGAALPVDPAATIRWTLPPTTGAPPPWFHGIDTGTFVWVRIDGGGMVEPIDIVALETTEYQISPTRWASMIDAGGPFTATIVTTVVDRAVVVDGPFSPTSNADVAFSLQ